MRSGSRSCNRRSSTTESANGGRYSGESTPARLRRGGKRAPLPEKWESNFLLASMSRCGAACDAGWQCLFIAWSSTTTLSSSRPSAKCPTGRELRPPAPEAGRPPDRRVRHVRCRFQRTKKSLRARDEARGSRGRGLGRPGWPRVLLTSERGAAQRDFDRRRDSPARPDPGGRGVGPPLSGESHLRPARRTVVHVERPRPQPDGRGLVHTARRAASPGCEGAGGGRVGLGREQPLRRVNHRPGHRRDHGPRTASTEVASRASESGSTASR